MMRKILLLSLTLIILLSVLMIFDVAGVDAGKAQDAQDIRYIGFQAKKDPFGLPAKVVQLLVRQEELAPVEEKINAPRVDLQGIIWSKTRPQAIVNNNVKKVGDMIGKFEIKEITKNGIILFRKGRSFSINVQTYKR